MRRTERFRYGEFRRLVHMTYEAESVLNVACIESAAAAALHSHLAREIRDNPRNKSGVRPHHGRKNAPRQPDGAAAAATLFNFFSRVDRLPPSLPPSRKISAYLKRSYFKRNWRYEGMRQWRRLHSRINSAAHQRDLRDLALFKIMQL